MKTRATILIAAIAILFVSAAPQTRVYICKGEYSTKYHYDSKCRGLSNCSTEIYAVSLSDAQSDGRTLCGWED